MIDNILFGNELLDEDDCILNQNDFWSDRLTENWNKGWSVK
jgi:hypothetical protein